MKKSILLIALVFVCNLMFAQSEKYLPAMKSVAEKVKAISNPAEYTEIANSYERIGQAEKTEWLPYYYAALYNIVPCFSSQNPEEKAKYLDLAKKHIEEGLAIKTDESELMVLKVMTTFAEMSVKPQDAMVLFPQAQQYIEQARTMNPENPRVYLVQGQGIYYTPAAFGGGKEKAMPVLQTAMAKFDKFVPANEISPNWGKDQCAELMK